ncbi:MAG TPA: TonB-dependent siderophore receptor [Methylibium sp.]
MATPRSFAFKRIAFAAMQIAAAACATAQTTTLPTVTVTGRPANADVSGFGDVPPEKAPLQASVVSSEQLKDAGTQTLRALTRTDASVSDAYNSEGYWDNLTVRGFVIDNRYNYRRDGLPINAETSIPLDNKARLELLKGTSGIQAGTSAPGGLVNLVVKRPDTEVRSASLEWRSANTVTAAVDIGTRFGEGGAFGLRVNAAAAHLDSWLRSDKGERHLFAVAGDWRLSPDTLLEAEFETSHRSQPSQPGFSMLGNVIPDARSIDPRINLNNQPWSQPVVLDGNSGSLRLQQRLSADWSARIHIGTQRLRSDDRVAFPFGCTAENNFTRYCSDGTFDLYDYRSDGERRTTDALDMALQGRFDTGSVHHEFTGGVLLSRFTARFNPLIYNFAGTGNIDGSLIVPPATSPTSDNTNRDERNTELYLRDAIRFTPEWSGWLGLRHTHLHRTSIGTPSGQNPTDYGQSFSTPWLALSYEWQRGHMVYASWGEGVESQVVPGLSSYPNHGQALPALKSRQSEIGIKGKEELFSWTLTAFDIKQPAVTDTGTDFFIDGNEQHRGLEAGIDARFGAWTWAAGAMLLRAERVGSTTIPDGYRPANVPAKALKLQTQYDVASLPGLALQAGLLAQGDRMLRPDDNSLRVPGWTRIDLGERYEQHLTKGSLVWRVGVDNALNRRAWQEAPFQYGHVYLFPVAPRTWRLSVEANL